MDTLTEEDKQKVLAKEATIKLGTVFQMVRCLDTACKRGAFTGAEMSTVGTLFDTLNKGLTSAFEEEIKKKTPKKLDPISE